VGRPGATVGRVGRVQYTGERCSQALGTSSQQPACQPCLQLVKAACHSLPAHPAAAWAPPTYLLLQSRACTRTRPRPGIWRCPSARPRTARRWRCPARSRAGCVLVG
jgi:hypothetical protein